ncbi:DDE-type integrase/transposase/recombinase [Variovorax sp. RKNM96]|uniref:integrase catalytic domain-containing protein n=1 Tax=Variovorax sp. RKNM96 TaxID=2681552 RepID=UPI0019820216|nr:DDE-type integrase/transposase/recombinase [Variovorax sp. RKNM96]QSI33251.1 DDE-type integrase/transposase/recombinase [Variovorax sp. RKNM96]
MLSDAELERAFVDWRVPETGRQLIRRIRTEGPVRSLQSRMDTVRTRFISTKMGRALYAESRTVELPAIVFRENDKGTRELWPQPCMVDMMASGPRGGQTRLQHTPDLFLLTDEGFVMEEWREEARLQRLASERPHHFFKDQEQVWHYLPAEEHFKRLGIIYRLRSADEHPRVYLANLSFLADYNREDTPPVPPSEAQRLAKLLKDQHLVAHLSLVHRNGFQADHVFQLVLSQQGVYVDLWAQRLDLVDELILYEDWVTAQADMLLRRAPSFERPTNVLVIESGVKFLYEGRPYEVVLTGSTEATCRPLSGNSDAHIPFPLSLIEQLFEREKLTAETPSKVEPEYDLDQVICNKVGLAEAITRSEEVSAGMSLRKGKRSIQRWQAKLAGVTSIQERLEALTPAKGGNRTPRLPKEVMDLAAKALLEHNTASNRPISSTYSSFVTACDEAGLRPMAQSSFYEWIRLRESVEKREGKRKDYQKAPIPLVFDYEHPVHGVLPHEVIYIDHTILNLLLRGIDLPDLGKPTLTIATDGATSQTRAFYVSYSPACTETVLMLMRDYVRRNGRLPKMIVLDNGSEFHSEALKQFCSIFSIHIRWRRRAKPRDSSRVERALGATEVEVIAAMDGNTICLKDPRMVSAAVNPKHFISWTLPALHGALDEYFFRVHAARIHPRLGMTPIDHEKRLLLECGSRSHVIVRYDQLFKLLTAAHSGTPTRVIDRQRGVFVDGMYYWNDMLSRAKPGEKAEVRTEMWAASVVYVCFRDQWVIAQARDGRSLEGRFRCELEIQRREENRRRRTAAQKDRHNPNIARKKIALWTPERWDERLREQASEANYLYERLGMTKVMPEAAHAQKARFEQSELAPLSPRLLDAVQQEPDSSPSSSASSVPLLAPAETPDPDTTQPDESVDEHEYF